MENFVVGIVVTKTGSQSGDLLEPINDHIVWFAKDKTKILSRKLLNEREWTSANTNGFDRHQNNFGNVLDAKNSPPKDKYLLFRGDPMQSSGYGETTSRDIVLNGRVFRCGSTSHWKVNANGIERLHKSGRILTSGRSISYRRYFGDFPVKYISNIWNDLGGASGMIYTVQTNEQIIQRCLLMTTEPGRPRTRPHLRKRHYRLRR